MTRVLCLGEAMVELSLSDATPDVAGVGFAGDTLNTAIYLKRSAPDIDVGYATKLGSDALSDRIVAMMEGEGLATDLVLRDPVRSPGLYAITTDGRGERSFQYWRDTSAARAMFEAPGLTFEALGQADVLYFSAISLAILPVPDREALIQWLPQYRTAGGLVAFDSNYRPRLWPDAETARKDVKAVWRQTDIALPSIDDEMALFGDTSEADILDRLHGWGVVVGALKRGASGPLPIGSGSAPECEPAAAVVDSTAAGDSFNAGYLGARLSGAAEPEALLAGHRLAARVVGGRGAIIPKGDMP